MCGCAVDWFSVVDDSGEVCHGRFSFPGLSAVAAGCGVLVVAECSLFDVVDAVVSPDVGFAAVGAWRGEFDAWFAESAYFVDPALQVGVECFFVGFVVGVDCDCAPLLDATMQGSAS